MLWVGDRSFSLRVGVGIIVQTLPLSQIVIWHLSKIELFMPFVQQFVKTHNDKECENSGHSSKNILINNSLSIIAAIHLFITF